MPPKRSSSPTDSSPRKRAKRSPTGHPSPSSPSSSHPAAANVSTSGQSLPAPDSGPRPVSWRTASSAEIDEALKSIFQLGGHSPDVDASDVQWSGIARRLNRCVRCERKGEVCSGASGTDLVCGACQRAHKGCSIGIAYRYRLFANRFDAPLSWARREFDSRMARLNPRSHNSYRQSSPFFTSLEEAIRYVTRSANPPPPSSERVGPPGPGRIVKSSTSQSSPSRSHGPVSPLGSPYEPRAPGSRSSPRKLASTAKVVVAKPSLASSSSTPASSTLPPDGVRIVRGPTIRIPPPARRLAPLAPSPASSAPLRVGDTVIPPGSDLARELEAFEATEAQINSESKVRFFKEQEKARSAAAETKRRLEAEEQRREQRLVKEHWEEDMRERERAEKDARRQQKGSDLNFRTTMSRLLSRGERNEDRVVAGQSSVPTPPVDLLGNVPATPSPAPRKTSSPPLVTDPTSGLPSFSHLLLWSPSLVFLLLPIFPTIGPPSLVENGLLLGLSNVPGWMVMLTIGSMLPLLRVGDPVRGRCSERVW
ncbi:hypothetical protein BT96DRAFT_1009128 [Gymnopus androsaceus JB14]|uniref:Uncharacterized protein n=1 Tax=Gymnopus androsaceus JB14 TaxID=1447944 RepID=A0A6A4GDN3_9AGAR|nr:hypothetical protein BT96DRAFT_1009128 [Gymnopus androsaceus JB14]